MLRDPMFESGGLVDFYAELAGFQVEHVPEIRGFWYPGIVSGRFGRPEPAGGSLLVYDFEGADPLALSLWLESQTVFDVHAWCLFTMP